MNPLEQLITVTDRYSRFVVESETVGTSVTN